MASYNFSNLKKSFGVLIVVILLVTLQFYDSVSYPKKKLFNCKKWVERAELKPSQQPMNFLKIFHLDLKGSPPILSFLLKVLPIIRESGANAILIEYEDIFPFSGLLKNASARNSYSFKDVKRLVKFAESLNMEVIPLVQTFGHLEYVLKLEEFMRFRELENFPLEICPLNREAVDLVKEMIRQVMKAHPNSKYVHIGCDEVRHVGSCSRCSRFSSKKLFSDHVIKISDYIRTHYPGVTPLIWDDMLRRWTFNDLSASGLGSAVEPVVWVYGNNIFTLVPPFVWNIYQRTFPKLWVASSFKGAFGETETLPDLTRHLENHLSWLRVLSQEEEELTVKPKISGIFLTGWSRYDHFAVLCELLPVGIPSLVLDLTFLDPKFATNRSEGFTRWLRILRCPPDFLPSYVKNESYYQSKLGNCSFPGNRLYSGMIQFQRLRDRVREMIKIVESSGWTSSYNIEKNFTSPWRLLEMFPKEGFAGEVLRREILLWKTYFYPTMSLYFDEHTRDEWVETNVIPLEKKMLEIQNNFQKLIERRIWPRRPLRIMTLFTSLYMNNELNQKFFERGTVLSPAKWQKMVIQITPKKVVLEEPRHFLPNKTVLNYKISRLSCLKKKHEFKSMQCPEDFLLSEYNTSEVFCSPTSSSGLYVQGD